VTESAPLRAVLNLESGKRLVADAVLFFGPVGWRRRKASISRRRACRRAIEPTQSRRSLPDDGLPHIFAAGDVIGYPSLASTSSEQAGWPHARPSESKRDRWPAISHRHLRDPRDLDGGPPEHELTAARVPYETGVARYREIARGQISATRAASQDALSPQGSAAARRALPGNRATELVHVGQAVLALGGGLDYFLETVFNYPTLAECYKVAALDASNKLRG